MNTNIKEMNLNEMENVSGGFNWKKFLSNFGVSDVALIVLLGPVGYVCAGEKAVNAIAEELN